MVFHLNDKEPKRDRALQTENIGRGSSPPKSDRIFCAAFFEIARPAVIAQTLPELQELVLLHGGQGRGGRQLVQKALVIRDHRLDAGLLEHDLRDPDPVGRGALPPGEGAAHAGIPGSDERDAVLNAQFVVHVSRSEKGRQMPPDASCPQLPFLSF